MHILSSKQDTVYRELCNRILDGEYTHGSSSFTEHQLIGMFGVSRTSVRIALCRMQEEGLIARRRGAGSFITREAKAILEKRMREVAVRAYFLVIPGQANNPIYLGILKECFDLQLPGVAFELQLVDHIRFECYQPTESNLLILDGGLVDHLRILPPGWSGKSVVLNRISEKYNYVCTDNIRGGEMLVRYLCERGHRDIALIHYGLDTEQDLAGRLHGIYSELKRQKLEPALDLNIQLHQYRAFSPHDAAEQALRAVQNKEVTAIIVITDLLALPLYELARVMKVRIPEEVSVIGFDDQPYSRFLSPPLTTVRQPLAEIAGKLGEILLAYVKGNRPFCACRIEPAVIERGSTKALGEPPAKNARG